MADLSSRNFARWKRLELRIYDRRGFTRVLSDAGLAKVSFDRVLSSLSVCRR